MPRNNYAKRSGGNDSSWFRSIVVFLIPFVAVYWGVLQLFPSDAAIGGANQGGLVPYFTAYGVWLCFGWIPSAMLAFLGHELIGVLGGFGPSWRSVAARNLKLFLIGVLVFLILPFGGAIGFKLFQVYRTKNGPQRTYYADGSLHVVKNLKSGIPHGIETTWDNKGNKTLELSYSNGKTEGGETRWEDGQMVLRGTWKEGLRAGLWEEWHRNGKPKSRGEYAIDADGKSYRSGRWTTWADNGQKTSEGDYLVGARSGEWTEWYASGQIKQQGAYGTEKLSDGSEAVDRRVGLWTEWHENGQPKSKGHWANGAEQGEWQEWYESGQKRFEGVRVDGRSVSGTTWHPSGEIARTFAEEKDAQGKIITKTKTYYPNNKLKMSFGTMSDGKSHGAFEAWSAQGVKQVAGSFVEGEKNGVWTYWDPKGNELGKESWENGVLKSPAIAKPRAAQARQRRALQQRQKSELARKKAEEADSRKAGAEDPEAPLLDEFPLQDE